MYEPVTAYDMNKKMSFKKNDYNFSNAYAADIKIRIKE